MSYDEWLQQEIDDQAFIDGLDFVNIEQYQGVPVDNPKHIRALKDNKDPLEYLVTSAWPGEARVMKSGADKYGRANWLIDNIVASTYKGAMLRHLKAWFEGEDLDPDSGESHLSHIRANCAILQDAQAQRTMIDDRGLKESHEEV